MLRFLVLLFAFVLPVQFAWAGAAAYCQHETGTGAALQHFGHHEHVHKDAAKKAGDSKLVVDNDCATCHAGCAQSLPVHAATVPGWLAGGCALPAVRALTSSAPPGAPDRPQWPRLA